MVDFTLTDEQKDLRELAHSFAEKDMRKVAWEYDVDGTWPQDVIEKAWEVGLMNTHVPEAYGGPGLDYLSGCLIEEEFGWGCSGHRHLAGGQRPRLGADHPRRLRGDEEEVPGDADRSAQALPPSA